MLKKQASKSLHRKQYIRGGTKRKKGVDLTYIFLTAAKFELSNKLLDSSAPKSIL